MAIKKKNQEEAERIQRERVGDGGHNHLKVSFEEID
jgi:hypothetical protein